MNGLLFFYLMFVMPVLIVLRMVGLVKIPWWIILAPMLVPLVAVVNIAFVLILLNYA